VGKPEGERPCERSKRRWEDNNKIDLKLRMGDIDWVDLAQDRDHWSALVNTVKNLGGSIKYLKILKKLSNW
jgi:hypothetical protein